MPDCSERQQEHRRRGAATDHQRAVRRHLDALRATHSADRTGWPPEPIDCGKRGLVFRSASAVIVTRPTSSSNRSCWRAHGPASGTSPFPFIDRRMFADAPPVSLYSTDGADMEIKMTPMIDVVFLLLVFFIWTASFQIVEQVLPSHLSEVAGSLPTNPDEPPPIDEDFDKVVLRVRWVGWAAQPGGSTSWMSAACSRCAPDLEAIVTIKRDCPRDPASRQGSAAWDTSSTCTTSRDWSASNRSSSPLRRVSDGVRVERVRG